MLEVAGDLHQAPTKFENPAVGLIAQLVEHCTGIAEVMGFESHSGLKFFSGFNFITV